MLPIWTGWADPGLPGYPDGSGYDDGSVAPGDPQGYGALAPPQDQGPYAPDGAYPMPYAPMTPAAPMTPPAPRAPAPVLEPEDAVTLVFRDGRPSQEIHNYALTRATLYVLDKKHRDIPLDQLDLAATERVNREAGVEFKVPDGK